MAASGGGAGVAENSAVEKYKLKRMIDMLEKARGNGTSMITLILPPKSQIPLAQKMLTEEYGTATNIKSRVNRLSVLSAITSAQQKLKGYSKCPENGLVVFVGEVVGDDGKSKKLAVDFQPFKPLSTSLYMCDSRFHTESLRELLQDDESFGFLVMDGNGALYGTVQGSVKNVISSFSVDLPRKHRRGGQSSARFGRLRMEARHAFMKKVSEILTATFISPTTNMPTVKGLVMAGSAEFKNDLQRADFFDARLATIVVATVDVAYGGESGFNQAIELAAPALANVKLLQEKRIIEKLFEEIAIDSGKYAIGVRDTMQALEMSAVEKLILWEDMETLRLKLRNPISEEEKVLYLKPEETTDDEKFRDPESSTDFEIIERDPLVEWLAEHYTDFGADVEFVTDRSAEGAQFVRGFGGIGGLLRWPVDLAEIAIAEEGGFDDEDDFI